MNDSSTGDRREFLERSLRDLDVERAAGDIDDADYDELLARYDGALGSETEPPRRRRGRKAVAVWVAVALVAGGAGWSVAASSGERLPDDPSAALGRLGPSDRLARARLLLADGDPVAALRLYDEVLAEQPRNPEALAWRGWVLRLAGMPDRGLDYLDRALRADPSYPEAHLFKGLILLEDRSDAAAAVREFEQFLKSDPSPELAAVAREALERARSGRTGQPAPARP